MHRRIVWLALLLASCACCGEELECEQLERLCIERCWGEPRRYCLAIAGEADERVCLASYRSYARYCPDWDSLFGE